MQGSWHASTIILAPEKKRSRGERLPSTSKAPLLIPRILSIQVYGLLVWEIKVSPLLAVKMAQNPTVDMLGSRVQGRKHYFAADSLICERSQM